MGLQTNVGKTVRMVCRPCQAEGTQSIAAYEKKMTGEGPTYRERQREWVLCGECGKEMAVGSLAGHMMTQHGQAAEERWIWEALATGGDPQTYRLAFLAKGGPRSCPVEGCPGRAGTRTAMRIHFYNRHVRDVVIHLGGGKYPPPKVLTM